VSDDRINAAIAAMRDALLDRTDDSDEVLAAAAGLLAFVATAWRLSDSVTHAALAQMLAQRDRVAAHNAARAGAAAS
jgi:hypothetical protein